MTPLPAVEFVWDNVIESMDKLKDEEDPGSGCIVAHCMGLGKTLSVRSKSDFSQIKATVKITK